MKKPLRSFPPYEGKEPYLFFDLASADVESVRPLLTLLYERGCRIWYSSGKSADAQENEAQTERMLGASLAVLYLSENARNDKDFKSSALQMQSEGKPIICMDADGGDNGLSFGLTKAVHIRTAEHPSVEALEGVLIRTEGFSQELIGTPPERKTGTGRKILGAVLAALLTFICLSLCFSWFAPKYNDIILIEDAVIRDAAHSSLGGSITEEGLAALQVLHLSGTPESWEDLYLFPALERLELPADCAQYAEPLLDSGTLTVVIYGR